MRTLILIGLLISWFATHLAAGDSKEAKPADPLVGTWRGYLSQDNQVWQYMIVIRGKGPSFSGSALGWRGLPEDLGMSGRAGPQPKEYPAGCSYGQTLRIERDGTKVLLQGADLKKLIQGAGDLRPDAFELTEVEPGLLVGQLARTKDGKSIPSQVLLCSTARWEKPSLPPPPVGATTAITCVGTSYHYRVYVPKAYDPAKPMPLVMHFSPGGNAAPLSTQLAEEFGWIMVGLTEAKNGPWDPIGQNRDAALMDLRQRLAVDWRRVVFAGDSGGARASARSQVMFPDLCAGLLMSIAGYEQGEPPEKRVPVFFITGDTDFNLQEILACHEHSKGMGRDTELLRHNGGHTNGGPKNIEAALRWLHDHLGPYGAKTPAPVKKR
jgi:poly(3-hydroxybutyrate) depolymerase